MTGGASDYSEKGYGVLRSVLERARCEVGCSLGELTALSAQVDPYRLDTPAGHRDGQWLARHLNKAIGASSRIHWRGLHYIPVSGNTAASLYFQQRRLEFDLAAANRALAVMRRGQTLRLEYRAGKPLWSLSGGRSVSPDVAAILIKHALVVPAGDALFADHPGQTWRYVQ